MTPLHAAAEIDNLNAFEVLQARGGDVHADWWDGISLYQPIHVAAFEC